MLRNKKARSFQFLWPYLLLAAALAGGVLWYESSQVPGLGTVVTTGQADVGGAFRLVDQTGAVKTDKDFRGRAMLLYFGYSFCPDVCPTTLSVMSQALDRMGADKNRIVPVFITIDPERDTPKVLKDYMSAFGPQFVGLTGSPAAIKAVEKKYHVYAVKKPIDPNNPKRGYGMDHSSVIYLMGPDGRMIGFYDEAISPDDLAKDLKAKI
ncbi:MAG TPA: SCO family protein [Rhizomicrobium sp.]|jgi:protein SCO1/2|nr:SCO family protein [Rhizomicrobium sp.]